MIEQELWLTVHSLLKLALLFTQLYYIIKYLRQNRYMKEHNGEKMKSHIPGETIFKIVLFISAVVLMDNMVIADRY